MAPKKPVPSSVLMVTVDARTNKDQSTAPAIVTSVSDNEDGDVLVNLSVFLDTGEVVRSQNVPLVSKKPETSDSASPVAFWATNS